MEHGRGILWGGYKVSWQSLRNRHNECQKHQSAAEGNRRYIAFTIQTEWVRRLHRLPVTTQTDLPPNYAPWPIMSAQKTVSVLMEADQNGHAPAVRATHIHWHTPVRTVTAYSYPLNQDYTDNDLEQHRASAYQATGCDHFAVFRTGEAKYAQVSCFKEQQIDPWEK